MLYQPRNILESSSTPAFPSHGVGALPASTSAGGPVIDVVTQPALVGNFVWNDTNHNGLQDAGESGVAGVVVTLRGAGADNILGDGDDTFATTQTDANGLYSFTGLNAGIYYQLQFNAPNGTTFTTYHAGTDNTIDSDAGTGGYSQVFVLNPGEINNTYDAGLVSNPPSTASLGDRVWYDTNGNGIQDSGEGGAAGVTVKLIGAGADGVFGTADDVTLATTTTNASGNYLFSNLTPGTPYEVQFGTLANYHFTTAHQGSNGAVDSDADVNTGLSQTVTLTAGQIDNDIDAGLVANDSHNASICGRMWDDSWQSYHDNVQTSGVQPHYTNSTGPFSTVYYAADPGLPGITVTLTGAGADGKFGTADDIKLTTQTDANGNYMFSGLASGDYQVHFNQRSPWINVAYQFVTKDVGGDDTKDSDVNSNGTTDVIHLSAGQAQCHEDAGTYLPVSPIVLDLDGNGIQTTALADSKGTFDLLDNGTQVKSGWISSGDAFLAVDTNGNGKIDSRAELFGGNVGDGFAKLATYDTNHDGVVDAKDADFGKLLVWQDLNGNHHTDPGELRTLAQAGIASLTVANVWDGTSQNGNILGETSSATRADGSSIAMTDVYFDYAPSLTAKAPTAAALLQPDDTLIHNALGSASSISAHAAALPDDGGETLRLLVNVMKHAMVGAQA
jgi:hypothetical protein